MEARSKKWLQSRMRVGAVAGCWPGLGGGGGGGSS